MTSRLRHLHIGLHLHRSEPHDAGTGAGSEEILRVHITRRQAIAFGVFVLAVVAFLYFVLPHLAGLRSTAQRVTSGRPLWIVIAAIMELLSFVGYVALFRAVFLRPDELSAATRGADPAAAPAAAPAAGAAAADADADADAETAAQAPAQAPAGAEAAAGAGSRIGWAASYEITMAGLVATRLFAAAGAGGIALTAWALRRAGFTARTVAARLVAFNVLLYTVYAASLLIDGLGLGLGLFPGGGSAAITLLPAAIGGALIAAALATRTLPRDLEARTDRRLPGASRRERLLRRASTVPSLVAGGVRAAIALGRTRDPALLGAVAWWGFDIACLWAAFHAFGVAPPFTVIWMAYFVGMVANLLPIPGGIGGVEGGMIGAFLAFRVDASLAIVAVLVYRGFSFWLPTVPGTIAYFQLRHTVRGWQEDDRVLATTGAEVRLGSEPRDGYTSESKVLRSSAVSGVGLGSSERSA